MWLASLSSNSSIGGRSPASTTISVALSQEIKPMALHWLVPAGVCLLFFSCLCSSLGLLPLVQSILFCFLLQIQGRTLWICSMFVQQHTPLEAIAINASSSNVGSTLQVTCVSRACPGIIQIDHCESQKARKVQLYHDSAAMKTAWTLLDSLQSDRRQEPQLVGCASTCSPASANWACLSSQGTNSA